MPTPAADRLRQVDKRAAGGATGQQRVFDYNAAGWLTAVQLPEYAGQEMRYAYDDLGNVTAKTLVSAMYGSLLGYAETLAYDALSRLTARTVKLLGTTTWHTFTYDGGAVAAPPAGHPGDFAWGRLTHDRTTYGLDPGAVAVERFVRYNWQGLPEEKAERFGTLVDEDTVAGEEFVTAYTATDPGQDAYDRQGNLRAMVYPSGQAVAWEYQNGGTLREVGDGTRAIFSNLAYAAHGAVAGMQLGHAATGQAGWGQAFDPARIRWVESVGNRIGTAADDRKRRSTRFGVRRHVCALVSRGTRAPGSGFPRLPVRRGCALRSAPIQSGVVPPHSKPPHPITASTAHPLAIMPPWTSSANHRAHAGPGGWRQHAPHAGAGSDGERRRPAELAGARGEPGD